MWVVSYHVASFRDRIYCCDNYDYDGISVEFSTTFRILFSFSFN